MVGGRVHRVKLNSIHERVVIDRPRMRGTLAQGLAVGLAVSADVLPGARRERHEVGGVDLDLTRPDPIAPALLDPWPLPQSDRERDVSPPHAAPPLPPPLHTPAPRR